MSGSCIGMLLMGIVVIAAAPYVVTGAAVAAAAYGAVKLGQSLVKNYARARKRKKLEMNRASKELAKTYDKMESRVAKLESKKARNARAAARKLEDSAKEMKRRQKSTKDAKELETLLKDKRTEWKNIVNEEVREKEKAIYKTAREELNEDIACLQAEKKKTADLQVWKRKEEENLKEQKALTEVELNDAGETIKLLRTMEKDQRFPDKNASLKLLESQFKKAKGLYDKGMYETAFAGFQDIVVKGAKLANENALEYQERTAIQAELEARVEALIAEADKRRELMVTNEETGQTCLEDLNDFCGDGFEKFIDALNKYLAQIQKNGSQMTAYQMEKALMQVDACMVPKLEELVELAIQSMQAHYKKLRVLELVSNFMEEQGYETNWIQPEGDDLRRKLVVNFSHPDTGNAVSFSIDMEQDAEEMSRMLMDMMIFYEEREVTEFEKQKLRDHINQVLNDNGIKGGLSCAGDVGKPSSRVKYNQQEAVKQMV